MRTSYVQYLLVGLGGLFTGVTGPLLSAFVPPLVGDALGDHRTAIGAVMAIDNVLLLLLVPWAGAASDRASARGRGRLPIVLAGLVLASAGMALVPASARLGIAGLTGAMIVLYAGINVQRSPFQALVADLVPSRDRSLASGSVTFQMCVGAIVFPDAGPGARDAARVPDCGRQRARHRGRVRAGASRAVGIGGACRTGHVLIAARRRVDRRARPRAGDAGHLHGVAPAAVDLSDLHHVVRAAWHRTLRRPAGRGDHRPHGLGGRGASSFSALRSYSWCWSSASSWISA